jgi:putative Holliday junction resolvase
MAPGRRIAFDFGDVRIGVAITDASGFLATPLKFIANAQENGNITTEESKTTETPGSIFINKSNGKIYLPLEISLILLSNIKTFPLL